MSVHRSRFAVALMWAMIPLMVFGSLPRVGCICASGQHKFFCERHLSSPDDARCTCCYGRQSPTGKTAGKAGNFRTSVLTCCGAKRGTHDNESPAFGVDCPCRPVIDRPVVITAVKATLDLNHADHTPLFLSTAPIFELVPAMCVHHARGDLPPPPDLVTTLGVLLI
jgi:hypothetical protein